MTISSFHYDTWPFSRSHVQNVVKTDENGVKTRMQPIWMRSMINNSRVSKSRPVFLSIFPIFVILALKRHHGLNKVEWLLTRRVKHTRNGFWTVPLTYLPYRDINVVHCEVQCRKVAQWNQGNPTENWPQNQRCKKRSVAQSIVLVRQLHHSLNTNEPEDSLFPLHPNKAAVCL